MTPRVDAWMLQANSDWAVAELTAEQGFHSQACCHYSHALERLVDSLESAGLDVQPLRELRLKALSRMNSEQSRSVAEQVMAFAKASLQPYARYLHETKAILSRYRS